MEEVELKMVRIIIALALMLLGLFVMGFFFYVPFPILVVIFLLAGPVTGLLIWRHKDSPEED